jgi:hypothetical protein
VKEKKGWTPSTITLAHLQKLVKHGFLLAAVLEACWVPENPAFPTHAEGYMVSFMTIYERGFGVPPHQFLRSLLRYYGLEIHHLTPLGVWHIVAFMTLCEAYLGINPNLDLSKYFFRVHHQQDPEAELMISGGTVIHVRLGHRVDPYLEIPMPSSLKLWRKKWFYLKNDNSAPLPAFTDGHPVPLTSWGEGVARKYLSKIQPLREYLQQLWQEGLTRIHHRWAFFSHWIQPLQMRRTKVWAYPWSSYLGRPSPKELSTVELEAWIRKVQDSTVILSHSANVDPL